MENTNNNLNEKEEKVNSLKKKKKKGLGKKVIAGVLIVALIGSGTVWYLNNGSASVAAADNMTVTEYTVGTNDISLTLTGTGTLMPADEYTVTTLIEGEILEDTFEEGDIVTEDSVLYVVDNTDAQTNLEKAELTLSQSQSSYDRLLESLSDLNVKASDEGTITKVHVEYGDEVKTGDVIATVRNSSVMTVTLPFTSVDVDSFFIGQAAELAVASTYETIQGTISEIINVEEVIDGYKIVKYVSIEVQNPGGLTSVDTATATVNGIASVDSGVMEYKFEETITSEIAGDVVAVHVTAGDWVNANQTVVVLESDTLEESIESSESKLNDDILSLENLQDKADEYTVTSPISGTIIEKSLKTGDTVSQGKTLCTIYDLSYLTMTLNVDELDITKVEVGQTVQITAEAVGNQVYFGEVTKVSISGSTQMGATTYPVTIQIDEIDGLLPGMNVDATIVVESREDVVSIPVNALSRGNMVLVKSDSVEADSTESTTQGNTADKNEASNEVESLEENDIQTETDEQETGTVNSEAPASGMQRPTGTDGEAPANMGNRNPQTSEGETTDESEESSTESQNQEETTGTETQRTAQNRDMTSMVADVESPVEGYEYRIVEVGISDENFIEITSGLEVGDQIAIVGQVVTVDDEGLAIPGMMMPGMTGGGTSGGGMPSGGGPSGGGRQ